ncbi:ThuA domain-containing protein [Flavisolibacter ginsenosidimutans]|uniref:ThuA domain-containing protein n=1 Tax=Flavisolibacter ginsenosidimutans TaxID=661481 RepID=A0A5B8UIB9_9BACT|nr:ThuA domain-containing protein [Flavisolibacter ginsenosidimutans]QEC56273.1 ThuA domain-containing protein [Flavisolibacter ginsenosidimutans]
MKPVFLLFFLFVSLLAVAQKPKLLVFSKTAGYHHASIAAGIVAIQKIGNEKGFAVDTTTNAALFTKKNLKQYAALIFLSPTGNVFDTMQKQALQNYIENGGGLVGIHSATDMEYGWPWWGKAIGAYFENHPKQQTAKLHIVDSVHAATRGLPTTWQRFDEWYNFKNINPDLHVLITLDETSYEGGKNGAFHPVAWWHKVGRGSVFYTALGHTDASYSEPLFLQHLAGGIAAALERDKNADRKKSLLSSK